MADLKLNASVFHNYRRTYEAEHETWTKEKLSSENNDGPRAVTFQKIYNLAEGLKLVPAAANIEESTSNVKKVAFDHIDYVEATLATKSQLSEYSKEQLQLAAMPRRILVLGAHDDIEFLKPKVKALIQDKLQHEHFTVDYERIPTLMEEPIEDLIATNENQPELSETVNRDIYIYREIQSCIVNQCYDMYIILIGNSYGKELNLRIIRKASQSKRHYELRFANKESKVAKPRILESIVSKTPIYIFQPTPHSPYSMDIEVERQEMFKAMGIEDLNTIMDDNTDLDNLSELVETIDEHQWGKNREVDSEDELLQGIESTLAANFITQNLLEQDLPKKQKSSSSRKQTTATNDESFEAILEQLHIHYKDIRHTQHCIPGMCMMVRSEKLKNLIPITKMIEQADIWQLGATSEYNFLTRKFSQNSFWEQLEHLLSMEVRSQHRSQNIIDEMAERILQAQQPIMLTFNHVQETDYSPGTFLSNFWQPLFASLEKQLRAKPKKLSTPLIQIVVSWKLNSLTPELRYDNNPEKKEYSKFVDLPIY